MLDSVYLNLMVGPTVPVPAPREAIEALTSVQVTAAARQPSGFQLEFQVPPRSPLINVLLLSGGSVPPVLRVVLSVTLRGRPQGLIDGVITDHQFSPGVGGHPSTLTLTGSDLSAVMDLVEFDGLPYPGMPSFARVGAILAKYAALGVVPLIVPPVLNDVANPLEQVSRHQGTDLAYLRRLADEAGYVFYLEPGPAPGTSVAYWGPEVRTGVPQPALNVDMDVHTNVESFSVRFANDKAAKHVLFIHEKATKVSIPVPVPDLSLLHPPLGVIPPLPKRIQALKSGKLNPIRAALHGLARQANAHEAVTATGTLDVLHYGQVLQPRRLVGVRGAGEAFDGLYYVQSVTHAIRRGEYKQNFTLSRNGLISTVPRVPA